MFVFFPFLFSFFMMYIIMVPHKRLPMTQPTISPTSAPLRRCDERDRWGARVGLIDVGEGFGVFVLLGVV